MSAAKGAKAEENLQEAIEELEKTRAGFTAEALKDATKKLQRTMAQQQQLKENTQQTRQRAQQKGMNAEDRREATRMAGEQRRIRNNLNQLQRDLERLDENLKETSPEASEHVKRALSKIREDEVKRDMTDAQRALQWRNFDVAEWKQEEIVQSMSEMEDELQSARANLATTEEERLENALDQMAKWEDKLQDIQREVEALQNQKPLTQEQQARMQQLAQQQKILRERAEQMQELAERMNMGKQWQNLTRQMRRWRGGSWNFHFANYDMVIRDLNVLKRNIEKRLDTIQEKKRLAQVRQEDVPPEYRTLVDTYYEALSE